MALEELPHRRRGVDFLVGPRVSEAVDANDAHLATTRASVVTHRRERARRILEDRVALARVAARPAGERVGNTLDPFRAAVRYVTVVRILRIGQAVKRQDRNRTARARPPRAE